MRGKECARFFFRILRGRLVVFDQVAKRAATGLQSGNIEGMVGVRIDVQRNRRTVRPSVIHPLPQSLCGLTYAKTIMTLQDVHTGTLKAVEGASRDCPSTKRHNWQQMGW